MLPVMYSKDNYPVLCTFNNKPDARTHF